MYGNQILSWIQPKMYVTWSLLKNPIKIILKCGRKKLEY